MALLAGASDAVTLAAGATEATGTTTYGPVTVWAVVVVVGVCTFALRFSFIYLFGRVDAVPPRVQDALRYVPPAIFAALAAPAVVSFDGALAGTLTDDRFLAATVAVLVSWRTESVLATIVGGMVTLWILRFLI